MTRNIAIAERIPPVSLGTIEIRPLMEITGLPDNYTVAQKESLR